MTFYFISGLGADERAFQKLTLPARWNIVHLNWLPILKNETLKSYTQRFAKLIDISKPFCIVGLSFGGIVAVELNKIVKPVKTILISSISSKEELPLSLRLLRFTGLNKLVPVWMHNKVYPFTYLYFGVKNTDEKEQLKKAIHAMPAAFLKWAINEIVNWKNKRRPPNMYHIHGDLDKVFPIEYIKPDFTVKHGRHFMIYRKADVISKVLINQLDQ